jgi:CDP-6-deoxy-D-xylo-4-hexulose-3-dehydrase
MATKYKLASDTWDLREQEAIASVIKSGQYTLGPHVDKFENEFSDFLGIKHSIMVNSGSSANLIAITALKYTCNFQHKSVVIVPAVSWSTTYYPLHQIGLKLRLKNAYI